MLIEFSVGNYLSIKDKQTLRMDASSITEYQDRLIDAGRYKLLRSAVIYGANASGKSNVLKAMATMRQIITTSAAQSSTATIPVEPFLLSTETEHAPSYFEMLFLLDGVRYRYGFEADAERVHAEWLFEQRKLKEKALFVREGESIEVSTSFKEGKGLEGRTRDNALFLAICDQFNGEKSTEIIMYISMIFSLSGTKHEHYRKLLAKLLEIEEYKKIFIQIMQYSNFGFKGMKFKVSKDKIESKVKVDIERQSENNPDGIDFDDFMSTIETVHEKFDNNKVKISSILFDLHNNESEGTKKFIDILSNIVICLLDGYLAIVDELDAKMHPLLTSKIVNLFNDPETNPKGSQLIFATHDTNLLSYGQFRRDQIYFTEKDKYGVTSLYSLVDYKEEDGSTVRKDRSFEKDYIQGRYGAIPYIGDFSKLFS
ncbi:ATP/GTP-binding protein [Fibrella sp. WM1]|uniref:AAA family ATPase n=1 Tax=Fibrella musci TaxID=3242485 RepID=UPI003521F7EA